MNDNNKTGKDDHRTPPASLGFRIDRRRFLQTLAGVTGATVASGLCWPLIADSVAIARDHKIFHKNLVVIDGMVPLAAGSPTIPPRPEHVDWFIKGGVNAIVCSVTGRQFSVYETRGFMKHISEKMAMHPKVSPVRSVGDIMHAKRQGKLGFVYNVLGAAPFGVDLDLVWFYKEVGGGIVQFTKESRNVYAEENGKRGFDGISKRGVKLVEALDKAKIVVSVPHTSERSSLDVVACSTNPVVTWVDANAVRDPKRHVSEELLMAIVESGGFAGVTGCRGFLRKRADPTRHEFLRMIDFLVDLMGIEHVTIGSNFFPGIGQGMYDHKDRGATKKHASDGSRSANKNFAKAELYPYRLSSRHSVITAALLERGYSREDIAKLWGGNWLRVLYDVWDAPEATEAEERGILS